MPSPLWYNILLRESRRGMGLSDLLMDHSILPTISVRKRNVNVSYILVWLLGVVQELLLFGVAWCPVCPHLIITGLVSTYIEGDILWIPRDFLWEISGCQSILVDSGLWWGGPSVGITGWRLYVQRNNFPSRVIVSGALASRSDPPCVWLDIWPPPCSPQF